MTTRRWLVVLVGTMVISIAATIFTGRVLEDEAPSLVRSPSQCDRQSLARTGSSSCICRRATKRTRRLDIRFYTSLMELPNQATPRHPPGSWLGSERFRR